MSFLTVSAVILLGPPVLMGCLAVVENLRAGELGRVRNLCGGRLPTALGRSVANAFWSLWLTALALPFGRGRQPRPTPCAAPPVILVHGLYHNPAAWFVFRKRLAAAGFGDARAYAYSSFGPSFAQIVSDLAQLIRETAASTRPLAAHPSCGRVLLVGHSLGGLIIRAACAEAGVAEAVAGVVTLGTPHRGSTLAGLLALGALGRGLAPTGTVVSQVRALPVCRARALSLHIPTDAMVLPYSGSLLDQREKDAGWMEACLGPMSHVGLLYNKKAAAMATAFLRDCSRDVGRG